jgi:hypothetical protein
MFTTVDDYRILKILILILLEIKFKTNYQISELKYLKFFTKISYF